MTTTATEKKVSIRYIGRRIMSDKLVFTFDHNGKEACFEKVKWLIIGRSYFAVVVNGTLSIQRQPEEDKSAEPPSDEELLQEWQVADALAYDESRRRALSKKLEKSPPALERAVNAIRPLIEHLDYRQRRALVDILIAKALQK